MKELTNLQFNDIKVSPLVQYKPEEILFFDIETTGFSPMETVLYLIGCVYRTGDHYTVKQWFANETTSEKEIISTFINFTQNFKALVHYNGNGFDIPYLIKKCDFYNINYDFSHLESIDIYKQIQPIKRIFKTENLKQKTMELFMNVSRVDTYSGGDLITIYHNYLKTQNPDSEKLLLLHNYDDIIGMTQLFPIINYTSLINEDFDISNIFLQESLSISGLEQKNLIIECVLPVQVPKTISYGNDYYYFIVSNNVLKINIKVYTKELKYFYQNYHDYYYLPKEDKAIHKSVAFYVDKNFRTKAKAGTCYGKKSGLFLPQFKELFSPFFKIDYHDSISYFEYSEDFSENLLDVKKYIIHIIHTLLKIK